MKHIFNEVHYELTRKIAEGGMGMVYEAVQRGIGGFRKVVAIKLIREEYSAIEEFRNNFIGEAKLVADLIHTNIVQTYHLGRIGEQYFMTMEFVETLKLTDVAKIEALEVCERLRNLYLFDNAITRIENLSHVLAWALDALLLVSRPSAAPRWGARRRFRSQWGMLYIWPPLYSS